MSVGYLACRGNTDLSVVIRTAIVAGGRVMVQLGAGIVSDSEPAAEWAETVAKGSRSSAVADSKAQAPAGAEHSRNGSTKPVERLFDAAQKRAPWREAVVTAVSFM